MLLSEGQMSGYKGAALMLAPCRRPRPSSATEAMMQTGSARRLRIARLPPASHQRKTERCQSRTMSRSTGSATKSKTCSAGSRIGDASTPDTTAARAHLYVRHLHRSHRHLLAQSMSPEPKMCKDYLVPLSRQVLMLLKHVHDLTGPKGYIFPSIRSGAPPMSDNTINAGLRRLGYSTDEMTAHGFRATASTLLNESGKWHPDAIERALAHGDSDRVKAAYHRVRIGTN